ncbi:MAG: SIS domain-containing protein [Candidatus Omnitrophica bacterium]|nr:SIS domain-containing protein [Candidatus Omnitrophota bacterium]
MEYRGGNMNNIERTFNESKNVEQFARGYLNYLSTLLGQLDTKAIADAVKELENAQKNGNTIFLAGNGGSATTASHMANDIGMDVLKKAGIKTPFRALALSGNAALMTAIANDDGYNNIFVNQLKIHYRPGDKLIAISASGNSPNIIEAAEWIKAAGGRVISFIGFDGGKLKNISDVVVHVNTPKGEYGPVEDIHVVLDHLIANWLQYKAKSAEVSLHESK